jgi:hypothetical protein
MKRDVPLLSLAFTSPSHKNVLVAWRSWMNSERLKELKRLIKEKGEELAADPEKAREWFYKLGTHNRDGSLTKQYGGEYTDAGHPAFLQS